ncbi:hypothetical protein NX059_001773 [Plenodomus lindquistii]|nr:hypothetical protein NX059_001773 [Plenodomus lindquistii]
MASSNALPTKEEFLAINTIPLVPYDHLDECSICRDPFDANHVPIQIQAPDCTHIFGAKCLLTWLATASSCPMCRATLFGQQASDGSIHEGFEQNPTLDDSIHEDFEQYPDDLADNIGQITHRRIAACFVQRLWELTWEVRIAPPLFTPAMYALRGVITDRVEDLVHRSLSLATELAWTEFGMLHDRCLWVSEEQNEVLTSVISQMVSYHRDNGEFRAWSEQAEDGLWMSLVALGIDFRIM